MARAGSSTPVPGRSSAGVWPEGWTPRSRPEQWCCRAKSSRREPLGSTAAKALAFSQTGAVAADMESSAVAEVASAARVPFLVVRAIVDTAQDALPEVALSAAGAGEERLRLSRLLATLARTPGELPALIRLAHRYRTASRALAAVAGSGALAREVS